MGYLETIPSELESNAGEEVVGRVESLLSGVVTNQQTCFDGLAEVGSGIATAVAEVVGGVEGLYSVALGLVAEGLRKQRRKGGHVRREVVEVEWDWVRYSTQSTLSKVHCNRILEYPTSLVIGEISF